MVIFQQNEFFHGITLPTPQTLVPLESVIPDGPNAKVQVRDSLTRIFFKHEFLRILFFQIDFLRKCLDKDPDLRWTCDQLLQHTYFDNFHFKFPEAEMEEFEKIKSYRERSRVNF